ncbi:MAG: DUF1080 domain-containing protein [Planctomycetes bacterium]|nr:DUF1080 domain-containing protein [Planctomycetota bacterium]
MTRTPVLPELPRPPRARLRAAALALLLAVACSEAPALGQEAPRWKTHDLARPRPPVVAPAPQDLPALPPSDAVLLFCGQGLEAWRSEKGGPADWVVADGAFQPAPGAEDIVTVQGFGDVQLHVEWAAPLPAAGTSQGRGNSGVFLMGLYEVQILDSFENDTYADGQAAAVYGQYPPLVNACRPPGEWQSFDIVFRRPRFAEDGALIAPARVTVQQNGILVQDAVPLLGPTAWLQHLPYEEHPDRLPLSLQNHGSPVRFRNIWLRELRESAEPGPPEGGTQPAVSLKAEQLERCAGRYRPGGARETVYTVRRDGQQLQCNFFWNDAYLDLVPLAEREFALRHTAATIVFDADDQGAVVALTLRIGGSTIRAEKVGAGE